tara:strand:+ start:611 stop:814 length:204 start_codon:yes stop_codon:yes gene_type:complete
MNHKITIPQLWGHDNADQTFIKLMREVIHFTGLDPETVPALMDRCYREEFDIPKMDVVYQQFLEDQQ